MFKQIQAALLLFCISISSYAYYIQSKLVVINDTNFPMSIMVDSLQHDIPMSNVYPGDYAEFNLSQNGWLLNAQSAAPFMIRSRMPVATYVEDVSLITSDLD